MRTTASGLRPCPYSNRRRGGRFRALRARERPAQGIDSGALPGSARLDCRHRSQRMHRTVPLAALLALGSLFAACGGGSSPSEPPPTLIVEALVVNADGLSTLRRLVMHYDGTIVGSIGE